MSPPSPLRKVKTSNFAHVIKRNPQLLTCNSYLNFLRYYKTQHPRFGLRRLLQTGVKVWSNLKPKQRKEFKQKKSNDNYDVIKPRLKWCGKSRLRKVPQRRMPRSYGKRNLNAAENIRRRKRLKKRFLRYGRKQFPGHFN